MKKANIPEIPELCGSRGYLEPGERWHCETSKITVKIPRCAVDVFIRPYAQSKGVTTAWLSSVLLIEGLRSYLNMLKASEIDNAQAAAARRKDRGYLRRSIKKQYGIDLEDDELDDYLGDYMEDEPEED